MKKKLLLGIDKTKKGRTFAASNINEQEFINLKIRKDKKMKNNIITENINGLQFNELKETMRTMIEESISSLSYDGGYNDKKDYLSHLAWYKDCEMSSYLVYLPEIYDEEGLKIGEGLSTIAHEFVLNDDTRADFESAFEQARDEAFDARLKEIAEEIEEIDDDDIKDIDIDNEGCDEEIGSRISVCETR